MCKIVIFPQRSLKKIADKQGICKPQNQFGISCNPSMHQGLRAISDCNVTLFPVFRYKYM